MEESNQEKTMSSVHVLTGELKGTKQEIVDANLDTLVLPESWKFLLLIPKWEKTREPS